jgi:hypothetical protein
VLKAMEGLTNEGERDSTFEGRGACDNGLHARTAFSSAMSSRSHAAGDSSEKTGDGESMGVSTGVPRFSR